MALTFDPSFQHQLARESWTFYSLGICVIAFRMYARSKNGGIQRLQTDDYLMLLVACFYTTLIVCLNVIASGGGSNLFEPSEFPKFSQEEIQERIKGSKIVVVSEQAMLNSIYMIKVCLLFMYNRLTDGLFQQNLVRVLAVYVACCWIGTELAFFFACRPFQGYWAVPPPDPQCTTLQHYAIAQACFNISSDFFMLMIPLPLVLKVHLPLKQKVVLLAIFSMGFFVIIAAILTKVFNLKDVYSTVYMLWYTRESSVAVYVSNIPMIWPVLRKWFPSLDSFTPGGVDSYSRSRRQSKSGELGGGTKRSHNLSVRSHNLGISKASRMGTTDASNSDDADFDKYGSTVRVKTTARPVSLNSHGTTHSDPASNAASNSSLTPLNSWVKQVRGIKAETTFEIQEENVDMEKDGTDRRYDWEHEGGNVHQVTIQAANPAQCFDEDRRDKRGALSGVDYHHS